jgi:hypothetical protein
MKSRTVLLSESFSWMDVLDLLASGMTGSGGGGLNHCLLHLLELCGLCEPVSRLVALPIIVVGVHDISPNGDDTVRFWHL